MRLNRMVAATLAVLLVAAPRAAEACAVCFGKIDSPLGKGLHWGVFVLLAFITLMLAAFGALAVYLVRRSARVEAEEMMENTRPVAES